MTAIPPEFELDVSEPKAANAARCREAQRPAPKRKSAHFEYAFGRWFATSAEPEFVLA